MSNIVKINHIQGDNIKHIYIFIGDTVIKTKTKNYGPEGEKFFSIEEWATIQRKEIPHSIVLHYIHGDDTVGTTKKKNHYIPET
jgi:5'(3')-deoxyribonucleotidase